MFTTEAQEYHHSWVWGAYSGSQKVMVSCEAIFIVVDNTGIPVEIVAIFTELGWGSVCI